MYNEAELLSVNWCLFHSIPLKHSDVEELFFRHALVYVIETFHFCHGLIETLKL